MYLVYTKFKKFQCNLKFAVIHDFDFAGIGGAMRL